MRRGWTVGLVISPLLFATSPLATWPLVVVWEEERGRGVMQLTRTLFVDIMHHRHHLSIVSCDIAIHDVAPAFLVRKLEGELLLIWNHEDSDEDRSRHHLDDVPCLLMCQVVAVSCHPASVGLVMWHWHIVIVVGMQWWFRASNNGCGRWWLLVVVVVGWRWSQWCSGGGCTGWWWWLRRKLFVCQWYLFPLFLANTAYAAQ